MSRQNISDRKLSLKEKFQLWLIPFLIVNIQRLYGFTLKRIDVGREHVENLQKKKQGWIYAIWHTNVLFSPYLNRGQNVNVMISASRDGELIKRVVYKFGNRAIRGSTSRGGMKALKTLIDELKRGNPAAITPDGPRGPAFKLQHGIITSASKGRVPIIPFHYEAKNQWVAEKAWDKHRIPKPFTVIVVHYGEPIYIPEDLDDRSYENYAELVEKKLLENMNACRKYVKNL
ncbi:MAG: lysophospholipid acyltransferase family protein [Spirochaetia bacterium]|nr:lysophospholipid acyltransferase family protein [Spirochaetia bacterium]